MKLLLDTCTFLWMIAHEEKLSPPAREALEDGGNTLVLNQVSAWEIQIKYQTGKLKLKDCPEILIRDGLKLHGVDYEPLADEAIWHLGKLPEHHKDPFDRMLVASALTCGMKVVTPDHKIHAYPVPIIW